MSKPKLLDLFCGAGGAARGYQLAGFHVTGVDIKPQPRYAGDEFHQTDAMTFPLDGFDVIHASPPCQAYSNAQRIQGNSHPDLIAAIRLKIVCAQLGQIRKHYVIENVEGAPLIEPIVLCGGAFLGLSVYRHRLFESSVRYLKQPWHIRHGAPVTKMGRPPKPGDFMHVVGNFSGVKRAREAMGIDWMTRDELREAIPPAYSEYIGTQLMAALKAASA